MKINEIIVEASFLDKVGSAVGKTVGGTAKTIGAVAGGVAGIPGAVKKGFQAGKSTVSGSPTPPDASAQSGVVQQAPGYKGVIKPRTGAAQYANDIASAIRAGASGDMSARTATATKFDRAPVDTRIGQWTKTNSGWVNTKNNTQATDLQADTLDRKWYDETQKQLRQQQSLKQTQPTQPSDDAGEPTWDSKKKLLTVNGQQYKKTAKGWQDIATDELIDPKYAAELNTAFDQASGRAAVAGSQQTTQSQAQNIPDVSQLSPAERAELIRQIKQKLGQA